MGSYSATMLVGQAHPNHGGIIPTHEMYLRENDRPSWEMMSHSSMIDKKNLWLPSVEHMLEDGLLMINALILRNQTIRSSLTRFCKKLSAVEIYSIPNNEIIKLYEISRNAYAESKIKIVLSVYEQSTLVKQVTVLKDYDIDMELCMPIYTKIHSSWTGKTIIKGKLK